MRDDEIERGRRLTEIEAFAARHGLSRLSRDHLERMSELAIEVARGGQAVRRAPQKEDGPAPVFRVLGR